MSEEKKGGGFDYVIDLDCDMSVEPRSEELERAREREESETNNKLKKTTNLRFVLFMESFPVRAKHLVLFYIPTSNHV